jgi:diketogulonate reductase-like aldo/keto reductase
MLPELLIENSLKVPCMGFGTYKLTGRECTKTVEDALQAG